MTETGLYCTFCESDVVNDVGDWYECYCHGCKKDDVMDYGEHWKTHKVMRGQENPYFPDTLEEKGL